MPVRVSSNSSSGCCCPGPLDSARVSRSECLCIGYWLSKPSVFFCFRAIVPSLFFEFCVSLIILDARGRWKLVMYLWQGLCVYPKYPYCMLAPRREASQVKDKQDEIQKNAQALYLWQGFLLTHWLKKPPCHK